MRLSVDDGCASDLRVADLAKKYEIETIFYLPVEWHSLAYDNGYEPLTYSEAYQIAKEFEVGSHTITHRHLTSLREIDAMVEIAESRLMLESLFHTKISKFCPPRGYTNEMLSEFTLKNYKSQRLTRGKGLVHIHPDSGANGNIDWREAYKIAKQTCEDIECWGHSWEWDKYDMWEEIEEFFRENM